MEKVVKTGLKFDLHIHSVVSAHKDGIKVKNNTLENIGVLIERLNDNKVNLLSNGDIGIFIINGEVMCKRYIIDESGIILKPDNQSCNYSNIAVSETDWVVQGKVIYW